MADIKEELKPLDESESGKRKTDLNVNIEKSKIVAYSPITSWQIVVETMETITDFIFLGSKMAADGDWSHEIAWDSWLQYIIGLPLQLSW